MTGDLEALSKQREEIYRQKWVGGTYNGIPFQGLHEGASVVVRPRGGEVAFVDGIYGTDINLATDLGIEIEITLRETSTMHDILYRDHLSQSRGDPGGTLVLDTGTGRTLTATDCYVSVMGELTTGDKKQGAHTYRFGARTYSFH